MVPARLGNYDETKTPKRMRYRRLATNVALKAALSMYAVVAYMYMNNSPQAPVFAKRLKLAMVRDTALIFFR